MILEHLRDRLQGRAGPGQKRSPKWRVVRERHLRRFPTCAVCGTRKKLEVHHIVPFQFAPDMELERENLITLCRGGRFKGLNCHLVLGHLGNFKHVNEVIRADAASWKIKLGGVS